MANKKKRLEVRPKEVQKILNRYQRFIKGKKVVVEATDIKEAQEKFKLLKKKNG